jgi:hypothetical protein
MLEPGSIIVWKDYSLLKKIWYNFLKRDLPYNKFTLITQKTELLSVNGNFDNNTAIYEPIRKYSKLESNKLAVITGSLRYSNNWLDIADIINVIRPNTISGPITLDKCKYYRKISFNEKSTKYIY